MPKEIAPAGQAELATLMRAAVEQGEAGVAALERIVALQERMDATRARGEFVAALARVQADCPVIERRSPIPDASGRIKYRYAPLENIIHVAGPVLRDNGFSWMFSVDYPEGATTVCCTLAHISGHLQESCVRMPGVNVPKANAAQNEGAAITYGKRLAFLNATGLTTADEDTDGRSVEADIEAAEPITEQQAADLRALADEVGADKESFLKYMGADMFAAIPKGQYTRAVNALEAKRRQREGAE